MIAVVLWLRAITTSAAHKRSHDRRSIQMKAKKNGRSAHAFFQNINQYAWYWIGERMRKSAAKYAARAPARRRMNKNVRIGRSAKNAMYVPYRIISGESGSMCRLSKMRRGTNASVPRPGTGVLG